MMMSSKKEHVDVVNGWTQTNLGNQEFFDLIMGQSPSSETYTAKKTGLPFLQGNADFGVIHPNPKTYCTEPMKVAEKDDVLISVRAPVGEVNIATERYCIGRGLGAIRPKDKHDSKYLYYYLNHYRHDLERISAGSTFKAITKYDLEKFSVTLPPSEEKQKIISILTTVDDAIQRSRQAAAETEHLKAGVMQELMTKGIGHTEFREDPNVGRVPDEWETGTITSLAEINPKCDVSRLNDESIVSFLPMQNVSEDGRIISKENKKFSDVKNGFTCFHEGDILFAKITPCMENGKGALVTGLINKTGFGSTEFFVLRPKDPQSAEFLYQLSRSTMIRNRARSFMTGTAGQQRVSRSIFDHVKLPLPPLPEQQHIATILTTLDRRLSLQHQRTAHYEHLKQGLMNELLTGKRRVQVT